MIEGQGFSGHYDEYFSLNTDTESVVYCMLANDLLHSTYPFMITIAEVRITEQLDYIIANNSGMLNHCIPFT